MSELRKSVASLNPIELIWSLSNLEFGVANYFAKLLEMDDVTLAVGAAQWLIANRQLNNKNTIERIIKLSCFPAVKEILFKYLLEDFDHENVKRVMNSKNAVNLDNNNYFNLKYKDAATDLWAIEEQYFLTSGNIKHLEEAARWAERAGGWRLALPKLIRLILLAPQDVQHFITVGILLENANQKEMLSELCRIVDVIDVYPNASKIFKAVNLRLDGNHSEALNLLKDIDTSKFTSNIVSLIFEKISQTYEELHEYRKSVDYLRKRKQIALKDGRDPTLFIKQIQKKIDENLVPFSTMKARPTNYIMLGFPRSGTTLLENVLNSHPEIETLEEVSSFISINYLYTKFKKLNLKIDDDFLTLAQKSYYEEINRRLKKADAKITIDKLPPLSAEAWMLRRVLPSQKYIFSIRHPFDAVMSSYRQFFTHNVAMDAFLTFEEACKSYDFSMGQWFSHFELGDPNVCYIRYEDLVLNFKSEVQRILNFLGLTWSNEIEKFQDNAANRRAETPSYQKVRKGISIGVQTSWKKYQFMFESREARCLDKWVEKFGYEGLTRSR